MIQLAAQACMVKFALACFCVAALVPGSRGEAADCESDEAATIFLQTAHSPNAFAMRNPNEVITDQQIITAEANARHTGEFQGCFRESDGTQIHSNAMGCSCMGEGDTLPQIEPAISAITSFHALNATSAYPEMEAVKPVAWFHCPKCGSSFMNVLYHHPDVCPFTPEDAQMPESSETCETPVPEFFAMYPEEVFCTGTSPTYAISSAGYHHEGISDSTYSSNKGNFMGMLRQPEQRVISAWNHGMHSWAQSYIPSTIREFAEGIQGCMTRMIGSHEGDTCGMSTPPPLGLPSAEMVQLAQTRLREGFSFAGMTDRWEESICLFHAMFGGPCYDLEFDNTRVGYFRFDATEPYDVTELEGFVDVYDGAVFSTAETMFNESLAEYQITFESCKSICPSHFAES